jgi:hypothetical protein
VTYTYRHPTRLLATIVLLASIVAHAQDRSQWDLGVDPVAMPEDGMAWSPGDSLDGSASGSSNPLRRQLRTDVTSGRDEPRFESARRRGPVDIDPGMSRDYTRDYSRNDRKTGDTKPPAKREPIEKRPDERVASRSTDEAWRNYPVTRGSGQGPYPNIPGPNDPKPHLERTPGVYPVGEPPNPEDPIDPNQIAAFVGDQPILIGDLLGTINQAFQPYEGKVPERELNKQKLMFLKRMLKSEIDVKLLNLVYLRGAEEEQMEFIHGKLDEQFAEAQLPAALEKAGVNSAAELDAKLREHGSSLAKEKRRFAEMTLAREILRQNIKTDKEITHDEMLAYYRDHAADYAVPERVRWEQLMVRFRDHDGSKQKAYAQAAAFGNEILYGAAFGEVAKRAGGPNADKGGRHDWTQRGSLKSKTIESAIFSLPVGRLSRIIEDENGFHVLRVVERQQAGKVPFVEAQEEIKEALRSEYLEKQRVAYLEKLRKQIRVWTIFDGEASEEVASKEFR